MSKIKYVKMAEHIPTLRDQSGFDTCYAESFAAALENAYYNKYKKVVPFSRDSIYGNPLLNTVNSGGMTSGSLLSGATEITGVPEEMFPSVTTGGDAAIHKNFHDNFTLELEEEAKKYRIIQSAFPDKKDYKEWTYKALNEVDKYMLPMLLIEVYDSFYDGRFNPIIEYVDEDSETSYGGHAMIIVGACEIDDKDYWVVQNSWGKDWGDNGWCYVPMDYNSTIGMVLSFISFREFGVPKHWVGDRYFGDALPHLPLVKPRLLGKSSYDEDVTPYIDISFDTLLYTETKHKLSRVTIEDTVTGESVTSTNITHKDNLTEVHFDDTVKLKADKTYNVTLKDGQNIARIFSHIEFKSDREDFHIRDSNFYYNSLLLNSLYVIQGYYSKEEREIVKEVKIEMLEQSKDGLVRKNPATTIDAVEGLKGQLHNKLDAETIKYAKVDAEIPLLQEGQVLFLYE